MKPLTIFLLIVASVFALSIPSIFASDPKCPANYSAVDTQYGGVISCQLHTNELIITQTVTSKWSENNDQYPYAQVLVEIKNIGSKVINQLVLSPLCLNTLKDSNAVWGVAHQGCDIHLPDYSTIHPNSALFFGYITKGSNAQPINVVQAVPL
ncbi:hypothetical protein CYY_010434 [Polysphondylium violaceum]|uniref:Carbohydrate binding domain-containing protein n=1 Tax=Polysphondylium violaceum TaxID=133409 RepID=A0A8J4PLB6_9MYCE|nr:hypothetical protein CYY_010434 [Polysphondylium violaceum]